jgi:hypothetical protein
VAGLDHVVLHVRSETVLRAEEGRKSDRAVLAEQVCDVSELAIDRGRIANEADPLAVKGGRCEQTLATELYTHALDYFTLLPRDAQAHNGLLPIDFAAKKSFKQRSARSKTTTVNASDVFRGS